MPVITPISPLPFDSFSVTLAAGTDTVLDPQPYNNTKEVLLYNPGTEAIWVKCHRVVATPAGAEIDLSNSPNQPVPLVGDTITIDGNVLTAAAGPRVSGTDTFSVDARATSTVTVNGGLSVGDTITLQRGSGTATITGIAGVRAPGSDDFTVDANTTTQAANIVAAINDSNFGGSGITAGLFATAANAGPVITVTAGYREFFRGANGNTSALSNPGGGNGLQITASLADPTDLTITDFTGGVNADGGIKLPSGLTEVNRGEDYAQNITAAILDPANSFAGAGFSAAWNRQTNNVDLRVISPLGTAGNGLVITESADGVTVTSPTSGGVDAETLTAANSTVIPAGGAITLALGPEGNRQPLQTAAQWTANPGANLGIVATVAGGQDDIDLNVTYVNNRGYPFGV